jgi:hypothetical protein
MGSEFLSAHGMRNEIEASEQKDDVLKEKEKSLNRQRSIKEARSGGSVSVRKRSEGGYSMVTQR